MSTQGIRLTHLLQYGFIAIPVAFAGFPLYVLAPDFYATQYGLSLTLLGSLLLIIRLFDAVQDPLIGWLTDRLRGQFLLLLSIAGVILCLSVYGLFNVDVSLPAVWFAICMAFAVSAYSILTIVLGAQATLWTTNKNQQTRIAGARESLGLIGLLIAVSTPALLTDWVSPDDVYVWYSVILFILMFIGLVSFSTLNVSLPKPISTHRGVSPLSAWRALSKDSLRLFVVYGLSMLASSVPAVLVIFFVRDLLGAEQLTGLFLLLYFLSGAAAMPIWVRVSARIGKYKAWCLANTIAVAGFIGAFFLGLGDVWAYAMVCIVSGLALGADLTLPPSILADDINSRSSTAYAGTQYAFLAFIGKASLALASAIALPILDLAGFKPEAINSPSALATLSAAYALIPCILKIIAAVLLYCFFIRSNSGGNNENLQNHGNHRNSTHA